MMALFALFQHAKPILPKPVGPLSMAAPVSSITAASTAGGRKWSVNLKLWIPPCGSVTRSSSHVLISLSDSNHIPMPH